METTICFLGPSGQKLLCVYVSSVKWRSHVDETSLILTDVDGLSWNAISQASW